jgi:hypothetical protein
LPRNGVAGPPHFWPKGGRTGCMGVAEATLGLWGWSGHPERPKKKKNGKMGFGLWGWPNHPLGPGGGFGTPPTGRRGWPKPPPGPSGWSGHPQNPKPIFSFFFFFWPFGVAGPPPKAWGGFGHPAIPPPPLFFLIPSFFQKKKILKFAKLRRFAQNGVVLEWRV